MGEVSSVGWLKGVVWSTLGGLGWVWWNAGVDGSQGGESIMCQGSSFGGPGAH